MIAVEVKDLTHSINNKKILNNILVGYEKLLYLAKKMSFFELKRKYK